MNIHSFLTATSYQDKRADPEAPPDQPGLTMPDNAVGYEPELS